SRVPRTRECRKPWRSKRQSNLHSAQASPPRKPARSRRRKSRHRKRSNEGALRWPQRAFWIGRATSMRVVGGTAGGIPLHTPKGAGEALRPTMEIVKNAIFNTLAESIEGIRVLDLFAGVGGLGIEALSRGAASCVFVESDKRVCDSI